MARRRGRPTKLSAEVRALYLEALGRGLSRGQAAAYAGVDSSTVRRWRRRAREGGRGSQTLRSFFSAADRAEASHAADLMDRVREASEGDDPDWRSAAWLLTRRHGYTEARQGEVPERPVLEGETPLERTRGVQELVRRQLETAQRAGSHQAAASLLRHLRELDAEIQLLEAEAADRSHTPEAEYLQRLRDAAEAMPEAHLAVLAEVWLARHGLRTERDPERTRGRAINRPPEEPAP